MLDCAGAQFMRSAQAAGCSAAMPNMMSCHNRRRAKAARVCQSDGRPDAAVARQV